MFRVCICYCCCWALLTTNDEIANMSGPNSEVCLSQSSMESIRCEGRWVAGLATSRFSNWSIGVAHHHTNLIRIMIYMSTCAENVDYDRWSATNKNINGSFLCSRPSSRIKGTSSWAFEHIQHTNNNNILHRSYYLYMCSSSRRAPLHRLVFPFHSIVMITAHFPMINGHLPWHHGISAINFD